MSFKRLGFALIFFLWATSAPLFANPHCVSALAFRAADTQSWDSFLKQSLEVLEFPPELVPRLETLGFHHVEDILDAIEGRRNFPPGTNYHLQKISIARFLQHPELPQKTLERIQFVITQESKKDYSGKWKDIGHKWLPRVELIRMSREEHERFLDLPIEVLTVDSKTEGALLGAGLRRIRDLVNINPAHTFLGRKASFLRLRAALENIGVYWNDFYGLLGKKGEQRPAANLSDAEFKKYLPNLYERLEPEELKKLSVDDDYLMIPKRIANLMAGDNYKYRWRVRATVADIYKWYKLVKGQRRDRVTDDDMEAIRPLMEHLEPKN